ncbi:LLM class flavin-dependent oxidoreductase [Chelatococcus asaccharovorans]|uniref:Alkanesulfonate monooxygenase SsuD/methylene tetrahydromethanopterin reductase-like flavin-dependent oxidoreductase (Luciferase family) n=1 Tax=Chelatococcus asaccharovorans TaxID=28210 RepID=A0A2V3UGH4_9HYPH|nr:LLM class flavin-dependent oxidoreductase [Chelatococcus asaccharovorans]MBS7703786.1 LLM class flavin-dependent oxidoreductase [Chelatococcus asaccharovorans]PXW57946.1 alkanesulfonate monooxygenase SsuD/methylene tetrahydromethanopterin reductase-like flavin-dependent oxidoreductase (luciferase family) [Chelatococcus asaccharovorans]
MTIRHISFLTPGNFPDDAPREGLEKSLRLFEAGERLGFDGGWVRSRHLERGVASAATFLAAASQRTKQIELGSGVIQLGYENPFRLAEDLATVDVLSGGRLQAGISAGPPGHGPLLGERLFDFDPSGIDFSHARALRLRDNLKGEIFGPEDVLVPSPAGNQRPRLHPVSPGLTERLWYGGGSLRSAEWAGRNGFHILIGNVCQGEETDDFFVAQKAQLDRFHAHWSAPYAPRVALGRVVVPLDSASPRSREKHLTFAAGRNDRTLEPQGDRRILFSRDLVGSSDQIVEWLAKDPILPDVSEFRLELPYDLDLEDYEQILGDFVGKIAPRLGWKHALSAA